MFSALLRFLLGGSSGDQPSTPIPSNRFVKLEDDRLISMQAPKRLIELKNIQRAVKIDINARLVRADKDRLAEVKTQRLIKVSD